MLDRVEIRTHGSFVLVNEELDLREGEPNQNQEHWDENLNYKTFSVPSIDEESLQEEGLNMQEESSKGGNVVLRISDGVVVFFLV